jgi:hypothetical protein
VIMCDDILANFLGHGRTTAFGSCSVLLTLAMNKSLNAHIGQLAEDESDDILSDTKLSSDDNSSDGGSEGFQRFVGNVKRDSVMQRSETDDYNDSGEEGGSRKVKRKRKARRSRDDSIEIKDGPSGW